MQPTKQQWEKIKKDLSYHYGSAYLKCDDYLVSASVEQSKMKLVIFIYINGCFSGKNVWHGKESDLEQMGDIARRFYCLSTKGPNAKIIALNLKIFGKKECLKKGYNDRSCYTWPQFRTAGAFIAHLKKHNPSIEVLDFETYKQALDALPKESIDEGKQ